MGADGTAVEGRALWEGDRCETDVDECADELFNAKCAQANEHCVNQLGGANCACDPGWEYHANGTCVDVDECQQNPCFHGGACTDLGTLAYACDCIKGWDGKNCEKDWNECTMGIHACHANASCINTQGSTSASATPGTAATGRRTAGTSRTASSGRI